MDALVMPQVGQDLPTGRIVEWHKAPGDTLTAGEVVLVVESEKAVFDVEAERGGVLLTRVHEAGAEVDVLTPVAWIGEAGEAPPPATESGGVEARSSTDAPTAVAPLLMPQVGQDLPEGRIVAWHKAEGEPVSAGEVVLVVESEKAVFEVEAELGGVLLKRLYDEGAEAPVLQPVAYIGEEGAAVPEPTPEPVGAAVAAAPVGATPAAAPMSSSTRTRRGRVPSSPAARRRAGELGLDWQALSGSGPGGRVVRRDVEAAAATTAAGEDRHQPFDRMRRVVAERLTDSWRNIPHFSLSVDVDMAAAQAWRRRRNAADDSRITVNDLIVRAVAGALQAHPRFNSHVSENGITLKAAINIGIAVAVDGGLVVPVLADAGNRAADDIAREIRSLVSAARAGRVDPRVTGTFTISNLGAAGIDRFQAIINPPECAILAVGAVTERPVAIDGMLAVRPGCTLTLACDHRAVDGVGAAAFLTTIKTALETGYTDPTTS